MGTKYLKRACATVVLVCAVAVGGASANGSQGAVSVTVSMEAVAIAITSGSVDLDGPHPPGGSIYASGIKAPQVKNTGNVKIDEMDLTFDGPSSQEANCGNGQSWAASSSAGPDQFALRAGANKGNSTTAVADSVNAKFVEPTTGSGNIYQSAALEPDEVAFLVMRLDLPTVVTVGGNGCTIDLTLTAYAADD